MPRVGPPTPFALARMNAGLSQTALGESLEPPVGQATIARYESGEWTIPDFRLPQIVAVIGEWKESAS